MVSKCRRFWPDIPRCGFDHGGYLLQKESTNQQLTGHLWCRFVVLVGERLQTGPLLRWATVRSRSVLCPSITPVTFSPSRARPAVFQIHEDSFWASLNPKTRTCHKPLQVTSGVMTSARIAHVCSLRSDQTNDPVGAPTHPSAHGVIPPPPAIARALGGIRLRAARNRGRFWAKARSLSPRWIG